MTEINLATEKQTVFDLKAALQKAKEETQLAKVAAEAKKRAAFQLGVEKTQVRLAEELSKVCRGYWSITWGKTLNVVGVPANSVWRLPKSIYYPLEIREVLIDVPESSEQPTAILDAIPLAETTKGSSQATDQGQGAEREKGKGKKLSTKSKDAKKEKAAEAEDHGVDPQAKDVPPPQPGQNEDPPAEA